MESQNSVSTPSNIGPYEILQIVGEVSHDLAFPPDFSAAHSIFHVYMLQRYISNEFPMLRWDSIQLDQRLTFVDESMSVLAEDVRWLYSRDISMVKFHWRHHLIKEATWEIESDMRSSYLQLFTDSGISLPFCLRTNRVLMVDVVITSYVKF